MKTFRLLLVLISMIMISNAQNFKLPLWEKDIPNYRNAGETERADTSDAIRIYDVQSPDIAVYLPSVKAATGQAVVVCPGGAYLRLAYDWEGSEVAKWLNSKGIAAIILKYRLPVSKCNIVPYKSPLLDVKRAMRLTRFNSEKWGISKNKIGVMGFSAGGHLASTLGTHFDFGDPAAVDPVDRESSRPDFMVLIYPVITMTQPFMHRGSMENLLGKNPDPELAKNFSNELQVKEDTPETFIIHAGDDKSVPVENSLAFYKALISKGIRAEMHIYPEGGHGFSLATGKYYLQSWTDRCIDWMRNLRE